MQGQISIPPVPGFREHIIAVVSFLEGYLIATEGGILPGDTALAKGVGSITSLDEVKALKAVFTEADPDEKVPLTEQEGVLLYACYVLMSHLLVAEEGEAFYNVMYRIWQEEDEEDEEDTPLKDFHTFRHMFLEANDHLIADADEMIGEVEGYAEMRARLNALEE